MAAQSPPRTPRPPRMSPVLRNPSGLATEIGRPSLSLISATRSALASSARRESGSRPSKRAGPESRARAHRAVSSSRNRASMVAARSPECDAQAATPRAEDLHIHCPPPGVARPIVPQPDEFRAAVEHPYGRFAAAASGPKRSMLASRTPPSPRADPIHRQDNLPAIGGNRGRNRFLVGLAELAPGPIDARNRRRAATIPEH